MSDSHTYYYSNGRRTPLVRDPEAYAVRFRAGQKSDSASLSGDAQSVLRRESTHIEFIPNHNLQIYRLTPTEAGSTRGDETAATGLPGAPPRTAGAGPVAADEGLLRQVVRRLQAEPAIEFAAPVYRRNDAGDIMLVTRQFVVQFKPDVTRATIDALNEQHGVRVVSALDYAANGFVLEAPDADGPRGTVALANAYFESGLAEFAQPDLIRRHYWKVGATSAVTTGDGMLPTYDMDVERTERNVYQAQQWHLTSANLIEAWSVTRGRADVKVCILDDGVDVAHPEFSGKVSAQFDFFKNTSDGRPKTAHDNHGTACAGVAVAAGRKALGAAPACSLIVGVTPAWGASTDEARMFKWAADQGADVISCSWGPQDGTGAVDPLPDATRAAIRYCVTQGRGGRGCAVLFAAGNGNESVSNDGYASNPDVIAVAACTDGDVRSWYSDFGPEVSICAPSNGGSRAILTADRQGANGYNKQHPGQDVPGDAVRNDPFPDLDYTSTFGGTSSSTPLAAGVVALVLSVNPSLTPAQVRHVLEKTATKIGPSTGYDARGHSPQFGFGKVNAAAAVREAQRLAGGTSTAVTPTITALQNTVQRNGAPPAFRVDPRPNSHYAVEVAARRDLLDQSSNQPLNEYYASWDDSAFFSSATYTLPQNAWDRLKHHTQLFYRAWTSSSPSAWVNTLSTTGTAGASAAPSLQIAAAGGTQPSAGPTMTGPSSVPRGGPAPQFAIDPRPNTHYAVEFAATPALLDADDGQPHSQYAASWQDSSLLNASTYRMPAPMWDRLKGNSRIHYRAWTTASGTDWVNTRATASSGAAAPFFDIAGGSAGSGGGGSAGDAPTTVRFPSGVSFTIAASDVQGGVDYSDPLESGVPLLKVAGRGHERVSRDFVVKEFAGTNPFARIDVRLVETIQMLRDAVGRISIASAYRTPAQDAQAAGLPGNTHVSGQTAQIQVLGLTARDLARTALETLGCQIGIGLGRASIEIDVSGAAETWVLPGAAMTDDQFREFVGGICRDRHATRDVGRTAEAPLAAPAITGPETASSDGKPPQFFVTPGTNSYYAVEVAVAPAYLDGRSSRDHLPTTAFYGSWQDGGMQQVEGASTVYTLPAGVWAQIGPAAALSGRLYYRLLTTSAPAGSWPRLETSLEDEQFSRAPSVVVEPGRGGRRADATGRPEETLWRD